MGDQLTRQEAVIFQNLIPFTNYAIRVRARNRVGLSLESRSSDQSHSTVTTRPASPIQNPEIIEAVGHRPSEILVKWNEVSEMYYNGSNFQYVLEYCQNDYPTQKCEQCSHNNWHKETEENFRSGQILIKNRNFGQKLKYCNYPKLILFGKN